MPVYLVFRILNISMDNALMQRKSEYTASPLMGSYKLGTGILYKMISASSVYNDRYAGASRYEILALIHLTHIADASGRIEGFRAGEFMEAVGCSRREAFQLMHSLSDKGYISVSSSEWRHCHDLTILDNDFSVITKKSRYLNTNHEFFEPGRCLYEDLVSLSHTSLRLLLLLLYNYSQTYGYHASYNGIMAALGIKHKNVINRCLNELDPILSLDGTFYSIREDLKRGAKYGYIDMSPKHLFFRFSEGIDREKASYFKRHVTMLVEGTGCFIRGAVKTVDELLVSTFAAFQALIDKGIKLDALFNALTEATEADGVYNEHTLYCISRVFT